MRTQTLSDISLDISNNKSKFIARQTPYADLDLAFRPNPVTGDINPIRDTEAIKRSVINLVLTSFFERPFQPEIGSGVRGLLFEPADPITMHSIEEAVNRTIENFEPRVRVLDITSDFQEDDNSYRLTLEFQILSSQQVVTTDIVLERLR
jgi:phage baseplate assembly protein W